MGSFRFMLAFYLAVLGRPLLGQLPGFGDKDGLQLPAQEDFLQRVAPIITQTEKKIYQSLPDMDSRRYFEAIFWYKRDADPGTVENAFKKEYFFRRQEAKIRFGEGNKPGYETDRGYIYLLLGEPDDVTQNVLPETGLRRGYEEIWHYRKVPRPFRFITDGRSPYQLQNRETLLPPLEKIRDSQVLDRAEPYLLQPIPLTLPNLGFTRDIENLATEDKNEVNFRLTYDFFQGDLNRTEVFVGITFRDASDRGLIVHLVAYDPYENKVCDFKKRIFPTNGELEFFSVALEPDQYNMVLRVDDKDGRRSISRRMIDVPRIGGLDPTSSSLLAAPALRRVPLQGFLQPKKFVFDDEYFPVTNDFQRFSGDQLFLMQHFYNYEFAPKARYYLNYREINARLVHQITEGRVTRAVVALPVRSVGAGTHFIQAVYPDDAGNLAVQPLNWTVGAQYESGEDLPARATTSPSLTLVHPAGDQVEGFDRVVIRTQPDLTVKHMYVFLNGKLILQSDRAPWEVTVDPGLFSISGKNHLVVVVDTDQGLFKVERSLAPLRADEKIKTRLAQIYFNAFNEDLEFISQLDFSKLEVTVDDVAYTPKEVAKIDEPITYCFLVDTSYSMREVFKENIDALKKFINSMRPQDVGYFIAFNNDYRQFLHPNRSKAVLLGVADSLTLQRPNPKFADKLYQENETFLYDAVISAIQTLIQYSGRKVIVLVSDGIGVEGEYARNGMLSYARENDVVIYSLWINNNPQVSEDELAFLRKERSKAEKVVRAIGLSRFFAKKDSRKNYIGAKIRNESITQGVVQILAEESGGFHYPIFKADSKLIEEYVRDIEQALATQFVMTLNLPVSVKKQHVEIDSLDPAISIRCKSEVKVRKTNPLTE